MTGAFLTDENVPEVAPQSNAVGYAPTDAERNKWDREQAIKLAVELMAAPPYAIMMNGAILPNLEYISNSILNYIQTGKMKKEN